MTDVPPVTPVSGPSWLHHLGLQVSVSQMGRMGGSEAPPASPRREPALEGAGEEGGLAGIMHRFLGLYRSEPQRADSLLEERFTLSGADLYRLSCQSCHGPRGEGAPPEIHSLIGPVQATSTEHIIEAMKARGTPIERSMAEQLASQSEDALRQRLEKGGEKMPPFPHLQGEEVEALLGYLRQLAGLPPGRSSDLLVPQSAARVGEHVVKGTCHICHDATGPGGHHATMMEGIIPSLASFPRDYSLNAVLHQVADGSSPMMRHMGGMGMMGGRGGMGMGRGMMGGSAQGEPELMPALPFLTEEEVAASYFYLGEVPPHS